MIGAAPMADLDRFIADIKPALAERWVRAGQREGLRSWRDDSRGMLARFDKAGQAPYQFSERMPVRGGRSTPKYVHTGSFREQLRRRNPTRGKDGSTISTVFSINGSVMNVLSADKQRGFTGVVTSAATQIVQVPAHTRKRGGQSFPVAAYEQRVTRTTRTFHRSPQTYAQEWSLRPWELADMQQRVDAAILARFRRSALTKGGRLRESVRAESRAAA